MLKHLGGSAARQPEPGDDLVEYQQRPVLAGERTQLLEKLPALQQKPMVRRHGLDDDGGDPAAFAGEQLPDRSVIIQRQYARAGRERLGHTG